MPSKKTQKTSSSTPSAWNRIQENYVSLIVGLISLVVLVTLLYKYLPLRDSAIQKVGTVITQDADEKNNATSSAQITTQPPQAKTPQTAGHYTVQEGDNLWTIAEKYYGSGYNAYDIATANKIVDADSINIGQKLTIPPVSPKESTKGEITPVAAQTEQVYAAPFAKYVVESGDSLWSIAVTQYGDGYQWTSIAEANSLTSPNYIHAGNVLQIPRDATNTK